MKSIKVALAFIVLAAASAFPQASVRVDNATGVVNYPSNFQAANIQPGLDEKADKASPTITSPIIINQAATAITSPLDPATMTFDKVTRQRVKVSPIDPGFVIWDVDFSAGSALLVGGVNPSSDITENNSLFSLAGGGINSGNPTDVVTQDPRFEIPNYAVVLDVSEVGDGAAASSINVGISNGSGVAAVAEYNYLTGDIRVNEYYSGTNHYSAAATFRAHPPFSIAFQIVGNSGIAWIKQGNGNWAAGAKVLLSAAGQQALSGGAVTCKNWKPTAFTGTAASSKTKISRIYAGYSGAISLANQSFLTYEDGSPYEEGGKRFFIANANTPGADGGVNADTCTIWSFDMTTYEAKSVAKQAFIRGSNIYNENSGAVFFDRSTGMWNLLIPSWGGWSGGNVNVYLYKTKANILEGVNVFSGGAVMQFPDYATKSQYDIEVKKIDGSYKAIYGYSTSGAAGSSPFRTTLATATSIDGPWTQVGQDSTITFSEGAKLQKIGSTWYALAVGDGAMHYWTLSPFAYGGEIDPAYTFSDTGNHPNTIHKFYPDGTESILWVGWDRDPYQAVTFSWGNLVVQESSQRQTGRTFNVYEPPYKTSLRYANTRVSFKPQIERLGALGGLTGARPTEETGFFTATTGTGSGHITQSTSSAAAGPLWLSEASITFTAASQRTTLEWIGSGLRSPLAQSGRVTAWIATTNDSASVSNRRNEYCFSGSGITTINAGHLKAPSSFFGGPYFGILSGAFTWTDGQTIVGATSGATGVMRGSGTSATNVFIGGFSKFFENGESVTINGVSAGTISSLTFNESTAADGVYLFSYKQVSSNNVGYILHTKLASGAVPVGGTISITNLR